MRHWGWLLRSAVALVVSTFFVSVAWGFSVTPSPSSGTDGNVTLRWADQSANFASSTTGGGNVYLIDGIDRIQLKNFATVSVTSISLANLPVGTNSLMVELCGLNKSRTGQACVSGTTSYNRIGAVTNAQITQLVHQGNGRVSITASATFASSFKYRYRKNGGSWSGASSTSSSTKVYTFTSTGVYDIQIAGCNSLGCSAWTNPQSVDVLVAPPNPSSISVLPGVNATTTGNTNISWASVSTAEYYQVQQGWVNGSEIKWSLLGQDGDARFAKGVTQTTVALGSGTYQFRVRACTQLGSAELCNSGWRTSSNFTVSLASGFNLATAPSIFRYDISETNAGTLLGSGEFVAITQGAHSVAGGAVSYSVPIKAPPAINDLAPNVSLNYNSRNNTSGLLGVGWTISGMSSISRCRATFATEGAQAQKSNPRYSQGDRLCLNGQKLVLRNASNPMGAGNPTASDSAYWSSSASYGTELENFTRVRRNPNGSGFIAEAKSGLIYYYGTGAGTEDIHYRAGHYGGDIAEWALGKVEDRYGNSYTLHYQFDSATYEHAIDWIALTPNASIDFTYEDRGTDYSSGYDKGTRYINTLRLASVTTYVHTFGGATSNTPVSHYQVDYTESPITERLLVDAISECGFDVFGNQKCAKPLEFKWSEPELGLESEATNREFCVGEPTVENAGCMVKAEQIDLLSAGKPRNSPVLTPDGVGAIVLGQPNSSNNIAPLMYRRPGANTMIKLDEVLASPSSSACFGVPHPVVGDFNNDGLSDFYFEGYIWLQDINGPIENPFVKQSVQSPTLLWKDVSTADRNSDGLLDILDLINIDGSHFTGNGLFGYYIAHRDEDDDSNSMTCFNHELHGWQSTIDADRFYGDFNGDGLMDVTRWLNDGNGNYKIFDIDIPSRKTEIGENFYGLLVVDRNRDGLDDIQGFISKINSNGDLVFNASPISGVTMNDKHLVNDYDGDGYPDLLVKENAGHYRLTKRGQPDMLIKVTDGFGAVSEFEYSELVNDVNFGELLYKTDFVESVYPYQTVNRSMQVLKKLSVSNGIGGKNHTYYNYEGGRIDVRGRGFTGFEKITATDIAADRRVTTEYRIDWPFNGHVKSQEVTSVDGEKISSAQYFYKVHQDNPRLVVKDREVSETFNLQNNPVSASEVIYVYDKYGNTEQIGSYQSPELINGSATNNWTHVSSEVNRFVNDLQAWLLGVPEFTNVLTINAEPNDVKWVASEFTPEPGTKDIKTTVRFSGEAFESTTTVVRNSQGIVTSTTTSAADEFVNPSTERLSSLLVFEDTIYPTHAKNALGHESFMGYDKRFGKVNYARDPNGLESTKIYDALGRAIEEVGPTGTVTRQINYYCDFAPVSCPELAVYLTATVTTHPDEGAKLGSPLTIQYHDSLQRVIQTETFLLDGTSIKQDTHFDSKGRLHQVSEPYTLFPLFHTQYGNYNALGEAQLIQVADGGELEIERWQEGSLLVTQKSVTLNNTHSNNALQVTKTYTNHLGQVVKVIDAEGITIEYTYDSHGNIATTVVAGDLASKVTITHNEAGLKTRIQDPAAGLIDYDYNGFGELRVQTWAKSTSDAKRIETDYDKLGRVSIQREYKGETKTDAVQKIYDQDWKGALWLEANNNGGEFFGHNDKGLVTRQGTMIDGDWQWMDHTYDNFGRLVTSTYPDGTKIKQVYHSAGFHVQTLDITNGERLLWALGDETDERGNYRYQLYGNNVITEQAVLPENGSLNRIVSGKVTNGSMTSFKGTLQNYTYDWDSIGNLQSRNSRRVNSSGSVIEDVTERFEYDHLNRIDFAETFGQSITARTRDYQYDDFGNLTHNGRSTQQYARTNGASLYGVTRANNKDYRYDVFGNVKQRGSTTIDYDVFNKPTRIGDTHFYYGPSRQKVKQVTGSKTTQYYFGGQFEVEKNGTATTTTLRIGNYVKKVAGSTVTEEFHLYDHVGSTDVITNAAGNMVQRMAFDAFGNRLESHFAANDSTASGSSNYKGYTGHDMLDHLGLIHMGGRVYDPDAGRFLSADLFVHNAHDTQSYNRYSYVRNNPLSRIDPNGYNECSSNGRSEGCKAENIDKAKKSADSAAKEAKKKARALVARYKNAAAAGNKRAMAKLGSGAVNDMAKDVYDEFMGEALGDLYGADFLTAGAEGGVTYTSEMSGVGQGAQEKTFAQGVASFFQDVDRVEQHYKALNGLLGDEAQAAAQGADLALTIASASYYFDATIEVNGKVIGIRDEAQKALTNSFNENTSYFAGRAFAQGAVGFGTTTVMKRAFGLKLFSKRTGALYASVWGGNAGSLMAISSFGAGLRLYDQGVRDPVSLLSGSIVGTN